MQLNQLFLHIERLILMATPEMGAVCLVEASRRLASFWRRGGVVYWVATYPFDGASKSSVQEALNVVFVPDLINIVLTFLQDVMVMRWSHPVVNEELYEVQLQTWLSPLYMISEGDRLLHKSLDERVQIAWVSDTNESHEVPNKTKITHGRVSWSDFLNNKGPDTWAPAWVMNWHLNRAGPPPSIYDITANPLPALERAQAIENAKRAADKSVGVAKNITLDSHL